MKKLLIKGRDINALFIQPTRYCKGCDHSNTCYVKLHQSTDNQIHWLDQLELFRKFYDDKEVSANQITISVDKLPKDEKLANDMVCLVDSILEYIHRDNRPKEERPEVHFTLQSEKDLKEYTKHGVLLWSMLSLISFSELQYTEEEENYFRALKAAGVIINYNLMVNPRISVQENINKIVFALVSNYVDQIYLVLEKKPIGSAIDKATEKENLLFFGRVIKALPKTNKVFIDRCFQCYEDYDDTLGCSGGCHSNVSTFQVWPDGSVSGCAYAISPNTGPATNAEGILTNIRDAQRYYDWERCYLSHLVDD